MEGASMPSCQVCIKEKEIADMKVDIAVSKSDIQKVKDDINDIRDDVKDIKTGIAKTRNWIIGVLVTALATLVWEVINK